MFFRYVDSYMTVVTSNRSAKKSSELENGYGSSRAEASPSDEVEVASERSSRDTIEAEDMLEGNITLTLYMSKAHDLAMGKSSEVSDGDPMMKCDSEYGVRSFRKSQVCGWTTGNT